MRYSVAWLRTRPREVLVDGGMSAAVMVAIGRANWWLPPWAERLPRIGIEGEEYFAAKDAAAASGSARPPI